MPTNLSIEPIKKRIEALKKAYENGRFADALVGALEEGRRLMAVRTFNENKDVRGNSLGTYSKRDAELIVTLTKDKKDFTLSRGLSPYEKLRVKHGRQVVKKDLQFSFGLKRSIEIITEDEKSAVLQFKNEEAAKIARGQEQQITNIRNGRKGTTQGSGAVKIFGLNTQEKEAVTEQGLELIKEILKI